MTHERQSKDPATSVTFLPVFLPRPGEGGMPAEALDRPEKVDFGSVFESICGVSDESQDVELYDGALGVTREFVDLRQAAVGQIQWNADLATNYADPGDVSSVRWGSGTMISNDLFLTAGHLFDPNSMGWMVPRTDGTDDPIPSAEIAENMHVNFDFQRDPGGNLRAERSFAILQLVEYRLGGLDYAIVQLEGSPGLIFGFTPISPIDAVPGDMICIIGHPAGVPKRIEAGLATDFLDTRIGYNSIDTLGGNSGSGILLSSVGPLVGVHTNGGCHVPSVGHNYGERISSLRAASPILKRLAATPGVDGGPRAWGNPVGYFTAADSTTRVVYRGHDDHIHEMYSPGEGRWSYGDLSLLTGAPGADRDLLSFFNAGVFAYYTLGQRAARVIYRGNDEHVHELWAFTDPASG